MHLLRRLSCLRVPEFPVSCQKTEYEVCWFRRKRDDVYWNVAEAIVWYLRASRSPANVRPRSGCHEPGATDSLALTPVPFSPLSAYGSSSFPLPQPWSSSALRRLDLSLPYRAGSDISPIYRPPASLGPFSFVSGIGLVCPSSTYVVSC